MLFQFLSIAQSENNSSFFKNISNWNEVKAEAIRQHKNIFIDLYTTWCGPCKKMEKTTFADSSVIDFMNKNFVSIRIQCDSTKHDDTFVRSWYPFAKDIIDKYNVSGFPTFLYFDGYGNILSKELGFQSSETFVANGKIAIDSYRKDLLEQLETYKRHKHVDVDLMRLANFSKQLGQNKLAKQIANDYISSVPKRIL